jgi:uncharacterized protein (DUF2141 family)
MKKIIISLALFLYSGIIFSQHDITLEIKGVKQQGGTLYVSLFNSEQSYKKMDVYRSLEIKPFNETVSIGLTIPSGEYFFSLFQDSNGNGELDSNIFGLPKELVGLSNYDGKGIPGNFNRHKVLVNETTKNITVHLYKI